MTYRKISQSFGDWGPGADDAAHDLFVAHPEHGVVHVVDAATEEEMRANAHRSEWSGWTYVADNDGIEALRAMYAHLDVVDTIGFDPDESCDHGPRAVATCGTCNRSWCDSCDPAHGPLCPWCHGRGYSTAPRS